MHFLKYIKKIAREHPDKIIDFFIEAGNINYIYGEKKMYIESAINFYANEKKESNIRAHYIDIREYNNIIKSFLNLMDVLIYQMVKSIHLRFYDEIHFFLAQIWSCFPLEAKHQHVLFFSDFVVVEAVDCLSCAVLKSEKHSIYIIFYLQF